MKKKMLSCIMAAITMFTGLNIGSVTAFETAEHEHTWVETTETIHHDDEYVTKTIWYEGMDWYPHLSAGMLPEGYNKYHLDYGRDGMQLYTDEYDILCWYYGSLDNIPDEFICEWITIDNYRDYNIYNKDGTILRSMTYDDFINTTGRLDVFNNINPEFNPKYDVLVSVDMTYGCKPIIEKEMAAQGFFKHCLSWSQCMYDPDGIWSGYLPVSQEEIFVEAYDEIVTYHICSDCGESHNNIECDCNTNPKYKFKEKLYTIDFPYTENGSIIFNIAGEPGVEVYGEIRFGDFDAYGMFSDFRGIVDSNGILVAEAPFWGEDFADIGGVNSAEILLLRSHIWNSETKSWVDYPAEMLDYKIVFDNGTVIEPNVSTTTYTTSITSTTTTTTTTTTNNNNTSTSTTTTAQPNTTTTSTSTIVEPTTTSTTSTTSTTASTTITTESTTSTTTTTSTSTSTSSTSTTLTSITTTSTTAPITTTEQKYVPVFGDVNCDGEVDIRDVIILNRYLNNTYELSDQAKVNADCYNPQDLDFNPVSADTVEINEEDSMAIMNHIVHIITLPVQDIELTNVVIGDANGDGEFTIADIVILQNWLLARPDVHLVNWQVVDFNGDNRIDVFDLCLMKRIFIQNS